MKEGRKEGRKEESKGRGFQFVICEVKRWVCLP